MGIIFNSNKIRLRIYLSSGNTFEMQCTEYTISRDRFTWKCKGDKDRLVFAKLEDIEAVVRLR